MMIEWSIITDMLNKLKSKVKLDGHELPDNIMDMANDRADGIFNPIEALDSEQVQKYTEFKKLKAEMDEEVKVLTEAKNKLEKKFARVKNLENFFTSSIELKHDLHNKMWRVNEKTGMVEVFDQERAMKEMKEMGFGEILPPNMFGNNDQ